MGGGGIGYRLPDRHQDPKNQGWLRDGYDLLTSLNTDPGKAGQTVCGIGQSDADGIASVAAKRQMRKAETKYTLFASLKGHHLTVD